MDIFSKMGEELSNMGSEFVKLTKDATDSAKQHAIIVSENGKISEQYRVIGEMIYRQYKEDGEMREILGEDFTEAFERIDFSMEKIAQAKEVIAQNKGGIVCPDCGNTVSKSSAFCNQCGRKM
ncbi:MAG: hypothetical protein PWP24_1255 [Clostridiales bacterium]|nr:hypothetical protein [Clostridiales bacterium]